MLKSFILLSTFVVLGVSASSYEGGSGGMGGGGGGGYGGMGGGGGGSSGGGYGGHTVPAAVHSTHHVKHYDVPSNGHIIPISIDVPANILPVNFVFRSSSSHVNVVSKHEGAGGSFKETHSSDHPHVLKHSVTKPIIQEVYEIISPYRKITQEIKPVHEEIKTIVAKHGGHQSYDQGSSGGSSFGGSSGGSYGHGGNGGGYGGNGGGFGNGGGY